MMNLSLRVVVSLPDDGTGRRRQQIVSYPVRMMSRPPAWGQAGMRSFVELIGGFQMVNQDVSGRTAQPSGMAVGITFTAACILIFAGVFGIIEGIVGLVNNEFYVVTQKWVFQMDTTTWGWIHIIVGLIAVGAGFGLFAGQVWARTVAVIAACLSMVANFLWLPYYPWWALLIIAFDVFVIWAVTAHGRDLSNL